MRRSEGTGLLSLRGILPLAGLITFVCTAVSAEETQTDRLRNLEADIEAVEGRRDALQNQARSISGEVEELRQALIAAATRVQTQEDEVSDLERELGNLLLQERAISADFDRRRGALARTLAALQRLARQPPATLLARPAPPIDTARSALLLGGLVPALEREAADLKSNLAELRSLREGIEERREDLAQAVKSLESEQDRIAGLIERKRADRKTFEASAKAEEKRLAALAGEARDLRTLIDRLEASVRVLPRPKPPVRRGPGREFSSAKGTLPLPVRGRIVATFGAEDDSGGHYKGITIETRDLAQVIAPFAGEIVFAGTFRRYGEVLIIATDDGYHILLAGMARIDSAVGQYLLAGEPVGNMGGGTAGTGRNPELYVEFRKNGEPIDPLPWLASSERKVSG